MLQVWGCLGDTNQRWLLTDDGQILHRTDAGAELCVDIPSNDRSDGQSMQVWPCLGTPQQQWLHEGGKILTTDRSSCLDLRDGWDGDGAAVQLWNCHTPTPENQQWVLTAWSEPTVAVSV